MRKNDKKKDEETRLIAVNIGYMQMVRHTTDERCALGRSRLTSWISWRRSSAWICRLSCSDPAIWLPSIADRSLIFVSKYAKGEAPWQEASR